jgi:hypothetical protein
MRYEFWKNAITVVDGEAKYQSQTSLLAGKISNAQDC